MYKQMIDAVYALCNPSSSTVIADHLHCVPLDAQEEKVLRWLKRYLTEADPSTLARFVQFCTASQVLHPEKADVFINVFKKACIELILASI